MDIAKLNDVLLFYHMEMESAKKVRGGNKYKLQHIVEAKLQQEGCLSIDIKCSDEALQIANYRLNGSNNHVAGAIPNGMDMLLELMEREFNMFLSDKDSIFASKN